MNAYDNLEEFADPANSDIEEGERSAARIACYCDLAKRSSGPVLEHAHNKAEAQGLHIH